MSVKALACEPPTQRNVPLSRWSVAELALQVRRSGLVAKISDTTIWRWLNEDAIRPWQHRSWILKRIWCTKGKSLMQARPTPRSQNENQARG